MLLDFVFVTEEPEPCNGSNFAITETRGDSDLPDFVFSQDKSVLGCSAT